MLAYIIPIHGAVDPGFGQPGGGHPSQGLPGGGYPSQGLPGQGGTPGHDLPAPPVAHLPPQAGQLPIYPATPGHDLPPPGVVYPPLPPSAGVSGKALAVIFISGVGYRWTVIDTSLSVGGGPATPPPPTAATLPGMTPQPRY